MKILHIQNSWGVDKVEGVKIRRKDGITRTGDMCQASQKIGSLSMRKNVALGPVTKNKRVWY